jgi:aryl-alcohol dehydrogenase-like predicted oxidoreductase
MELRQLGGLTVPVLSLGTGTFGGSGEFFGAWGSSDAAEATRLVDICLDAGLTMFDSADVYSHGMAEEILGQAIKGRRDQVLISTKGTFRSGRGANDVGSSRQHLIRAVEGSLRRLGTDYIDLLYRVIDALEAVAEHAGRTVPQVALNWLLGRPSVANVIIGARNEEQLRQNLGAVGWSLTPEQIATLDNASATTLTYPYWHQRGFAERNPPPV